LINLGEDAGEDVFGLDDGEFGEVLTLLFKALVVLDELFLEKRRQAMARGTNQRPVHLRAVNRDQSSLGNHSQQWTPQK